MELPSMDFLPEGYSSNIFALSDEDQEAFECCICLQLVRRAVKCTNGHLFCRNCIGRWLFKTTNGKNQQPSSSKPSSDQSAYVATLFKGLLVRPTNLCPTCAVPGSFTMAPDVDLRLGQQLVLCSTCEWAGAFVDFPRHRHSYTSESTPILLKRKWDDSDSEEDGNETETKPPPSKRMSSEDGRASSSSNSSPIIVSSSSSVSSSGAN